MTPESFDSTGGRLLRELAPQVLGAVARRHGDFAAAEDAVQEALAAAHAANPERFVRGVPRPPALPTAAWINPPTIQEAAH